MQLTQVSLVHEPRFIVGLRWGMARLITPKGEPLPQPACNAQANALASGPLRFLREAAVREAAAGATWASAKGDHKLDLRRWELG